MRFYILIFISIFFIRCEKSDLLDNSGTLRFENQGLTQLNGFQYKIWLSIEDDIKVLVGSFSINNNGQQSQTFFQNIDKTDLFNATEILLTVDKIGDTGFNNLVVMRGNFNGNTFNISSENPNTVLHNISGSFQIKNPTNSTNVANLNGVWFYDTSNTPLLTLNSDSQYRFQAWLEKEDILGDKKYLDMGKFSSVNSSDNSSIYSGNEFFPEFPGEDFFNNPNNLDITFPIDLIGSRVFIEAHPITLDISTTNTPIGFTLLSKTLQTGEVISNNILTMDRPIYTATGTRN